MKRIKVLALICCGLLVWGCGSASNNDQGVSFTLVGFFQDLKGDTGLTGLAIPITDITNNEPSGLRTDNVVAAIGLQNNLSGQFVRAQRAYISYNVPGATENPPSTTFPLAAVMGPASEGCSEDIDTTLPGTITGGDKQTANRTFAEIVILPAAVRQWISLNYALLPEPPFVIEASVFARGVTSAGDQLDTNTGTLWIQVTPGVVVGPTSAS